MARSRARKLADLTSAGNTFDDGVISAAEVTGLGTAATTAATDYATAGQGTLAASALQSGGGSVTGNVTFGDNNKAIFGAGSDLQVYSTGANGFVENNTGLLILKNNSDNRDIALQSDDGSGGVANYLLADGSTGALNAYHYGDLKLATTSSGVTITGDATATNFNTTSDQTLKTNVETLTGSLDAVKSLRGVSFDWIENGNSEVGVIAQEVEAVLPDVVSTNDQGIKSVKYGNMVALLIEAMKEQQAQIDELKAQLNS